MLDFLLEATIEDVAEVKTRGASGLRKQRNPEGLAIRVFRDGSVYPSQELVDKFNLEYGNKPNGDEKATGNGFDVIDTALFPTFKAGKRILIVNPVAKAQPKVDLFGSTTYNEDGTPKSSVLDQGNKTYGSKDLIPMIEEIYGIQFKKRVETEGDGTTLPEPTFTEGVEYVDMVLVANPATQQPWTLPAGKTICYIPKKVSRGDDKGVVTTQRRETPFFYAFIPKQEFPAPAQENENKAVEAFDNAPENPVSERELATAN